MRSFSVLDMREALLGFQPVLITGYTVNIAKDFAEHLGSRGAEHLAVLAGVDEMKAKNYCSTTHGY